MGTDGGKSRIFISYSRADIAFADAVAEGLNSAGRFEVLLDRHSIAGAEAWRERLGKLILAADTVVFVLSPESVASEICAWEVEEAGRLSKRIIPVLWREVQFDRVPARLSALNAIAFDGANAVTGLARLIDALDSDLDWLREHTRLAERALEWSGGGRGAERLLRGSALSAAQAWLAGRPRNAPEPTEQQLEFLRASEAEEGRLADAERKRLEELLAAKSAAEAAERSRADDAERATRRTRVLALGALALAVVAGGAGVAAVLQAREARAQRNEALLTESRFLAGISDELLQSGQGAKALAVAWSALPHDAEVRSRPVAREALQSLTQALYHRRPEALPLLEFPDPGGGLSSIYEASFSERGERLLTRSDGPRVEVWTRVGGEGWSRTAELDMQGMEYPQAVFSRDGERVLATDSTTGVVALWRAADGAKIAWREVAGDVQASISPDGAHVLTDEDGATILWNSDMTSEIARLDSGGGVEGAAFIEEGAQVLTWGRAVRLLDVATGAELFRLEAGDAVLFGAAMTADGARILTWDLDGVARLRNGPNAPAGALEMTLNDDAPVSEGAFFAEGTRALTIDDNDGIAVWNTLDGEKIGEFDGDCFRCSNLAVGAGRLVLYEDDGTVTLVDLRTGEELALTTVEPCQYSGDCLPAITPDGRRVLTRGADGRVSIWDPETGAEVWRLWETEPESEEIADDTRFDDMAFSPDGRRLLTAGSEVFVWDLPDDIDVARAWHGDCGPSEDLRRCVSASFLDDDRVLSHGADGILRIWSAVTGHEISQFDQGAAISYVVVSGAAQRVLSWNEEASRNWVDRAFFDYKVSDSDFAPLWDAVTGRKVEQVGGGVVGASFSADGTNLLVWDFAGDVRLLDPATGRELLRQDHEVQIVAAALSADGARVVSTDTDGRMMISNAVTGEALPDGRGSWIVLSPDGRRAASFEEAGGIWTWEASGAMTGECGGGVRVSRAAFSQDGERLLTSSFFDGANIWDGACNRIARLPAPSLTGVQFDRDRVRAITWGGDGYVRVWDAAYGTELHQLFHGEGLFQATFSPDGSRVLSWGEDGVTRLWSSDSGEEVAHVDHGPCGAADCPSPSFDGDGRRMLSAGADGVVTLLSSADGTLLGQFGGYRGGVRWTQFSPDGERILVAANDGTASVWPEWVVDDPAQIEALTRELVPVAGAIIADLQPLTRNDRCRYYLDPPEICAAASPP